MIRTYTNKFNVTYSLSTDRGRYIITQTIGKHIKQITVPKSELSFIRECSDFEFEQWFISYEIEQRMQKNVG